MNGENILNQNIKIAILMVLAITLTSALTFGAQPVNAIGNFPCSAHAKEFVSGQEAKSIGPFPCSPCAKEFVSGQEAKFPAPTYTFCNGASDFAPSHIKKQPTTFGSSIHYFFLTSRLASK